MSNITHINEFRTKYEGHLVSERIASRVADALMADCAVYDEKLKNGPHKSLESHVGVILDEHKRIAEDE